MTDEDADRVDLESQLYALVGAKLRELGFKVRNVPGNDDVFGGYQAILFQRAHGLAPPPEWQTAGDPPVNGVYRAGSDLRKDGEAVGWGAVGGGGGGGGRGGSTGRAGSARRCWPRR